MFVHVENPHLGEGFLKMAGRKLLFEEAETDRTVEIADLDRGGRLLRRQPPLTFLMDTFDRLQDDEDVPTSPDHVLLVTGDREVLRFRLLGVPDEQWRTLLLFMQEAGAATPQQDSS